MGEGREGRRSILLSARRGLTRRVSHLISLVLIVVAVETQQLPVAPVGRIVVVVVILVMDRELAQLLAVKFASTMRTDPRKHFERLLPIGLLQLSLGASCHTSLGEDNDSLRRDSTANLMLRPFSKAQGVKQAEVEIKFEQRSDFPHLSLSLNLPLTLADFFSILLGHLFTSTGPSQGASSSNNPTRGSGGQRFNSCLGSRPAVN